MCIFCCCCIYATLDQNGLRSVYTVNASAQGGFQSLYAHNNPVRQARLRSLKNLHGQGLNPSFPLSLSNFPTTTAALLMFFMLFFFKQQPGFMFFLIACFAIEKRTNSNSSVGSSSTRRRTSGQKRAAYNNAILYIILLCKQCNLCPKGLTV